MEQDLSAKIKTIGEDLVNCNLNCAGIRLDRKNGVLPRCLILEKTETGSEKGCVIVGINPGISGGKGTQFV